LIIELLHENFVVILLVLFIGVMFWAFKPKKKIEKQRDKDKGLYQITYKRCYHGYYEKESFKPT